MNQRLIELLNFVRGLTSNEKEQANILAAYGNPPEDFQPKASLPVINEIPAFNLSQKSLGGALAAQDHGVPGPIPNSAPKIEPSLGDLLVGE